MQERTLSSPAGKIAAERTRISWMLEYLHSIASAPMFQHMAHALRGGEMSFSQLNAIYLLYRDGPQTIADLAKGVGLSHNAASRMVERLVQGGLVLRNEVASDRRQKRVELTAAGIERLRDLQTTTAAAYAALLAGLPEPLLRRFGETLDELGPHLPVHPLLDLPMREGGNRTVGSVNDKRAGRAGTDEPRMDGPESARDQRASQRRRPSQPAQKDEE